MDMVGMVTAFLLRVSPYKLALLSVGGKRQGVNLLKLKDMTVQDIMVRGVVTAQCDEMLPKVAEVMTEENISCIVIVDKNDEAAGIISSLDLVRTFSEKTIAEIEKTTAEDIMIPFVVEANPKMSLQEISNIMIAKSIHRVIVLSPVGRKPVGVLSATDIVKQMRRIEG